MARRGGYAALKNLHVERQTFLTRMMVAGAVSGALALTLTVRLMHLQVLQHDYFETRSDENRMRLTVIPPVRGLIYDRNGTLLAQNKPAFVLEVVREQVTDLDATLAQIGRIINLTEADVARFRERLKKSPPYRGVPLRTNLSIEEVARYEINRQDFVGVDVTAGLTRNYPLGASASHVVGYIGGITAEDLKTPEAEKKYQGSNYIGRTGVEKSHEDDLRGMYGSKVVETNASGRPLRELDYRRGSPGQNLFLTIDAKVQLAAEKALGARNGAVVAIAPDTGEVLALVSKPGFDPHLFVEGVDVPTYRALNDDASHPLFNRVLQGQYSPGSTIKPFMALAGMDNNVSTTHERVFCVGEFTLPGSDRKYRCWKRKGHGWLDVNGAITQSCDVFFYQVALGLGIDRIDAFLEGFGLGKATGLDLPGEKGGLLPTREWKKRARKENWYPGETLNVGIGQGYMTLTPLQMAQMAARMAMRGHGFRPHIVHAEQDALSGEQVTLAPEPLPPIAVHDAQNWQRTIDAMENVVHSPSGTAYRISLKAPYRMAGKTGTVQVAGLAQDEAAPNMMSVPEHLRDHALFIAFAPTEHPKIAVAILVEHAGHGGSEAAPIARQVIDTYLIPMMQASGELPSEGTGLPVPARGQGNADTADVHPDEVDNGAPVETPEADR
ncbi:MAG TPA: penicillin-binding protein 2 [Candidatus Binatia bacterium]|nr:penicillin-binding protein 2 [Candidatus Binatia bacterium]